MKSLIQRGVFVAAVFAMLAFLVVNRTSANAQSDNTATPETFTLTGDEQALWATVAGELAAQNQQTPAPASHQAAQGQSQVTTTEQEYKNIQVLKGIPAWQLQSLMHLFNTSLGVRCDFCHVREGNRFEFDRDDKQSKKVARKMIQMTMDINKSSFNNRVQVSCYTCHGGHEHPTSIPTLPAPIVNPAPENAGAKPAEPMPTADQILEKYVQAVGGKAAVEKLKTATFKGIYQPQRGAGEVPLEMMVSGDKIFVTVTTPQGANTRAFNGTKGWGQAGGQMHEMEAGEVMTIKDLADAFNVIKLKEPFPKFSFRGKDKIGDREAYILIGALPDKRRVRLYFDTQTGLLLRKQIFTELPVAVDPTQIDFEDYRDVDGVKVPFTVHTLYAEPGFSGTRKFTEIKYNVPVEEAKFEMPKK